jgi:hypothetical protein
MVRVADKGDLHVHQAERDQSGSVKDWNVIGLTDLGGSLVERHVYTPYGELTVDQGERDRRGSVNSYGDYTASHYVDATDKGTPGTDCTGTVSGACRILDLDFGGDYDSTDATKFDALPQGLARHPGHIATAVHQPFSHQGLLFDPEIGSYQIRHQVQHIRHQVPEIRAPTHVRPKRLQERSQLRLQGSNLIRSHHQVS